MKKLTKKKKATEVKATPPGKNYVITEAQLQTLINYLATKPYSEVGQALPELKALPEVPRAPVKLR